MEKITRRLFLRNSAVAGAVATAAVPAAAASEKALTPHELIQLRIDQLAEAMRLVTEGEGACTALIRRDHRHPTGDYVLAYRTWHDSDGVYHDEDILRTGRAKLFPATQG